jgi:nitrogen regulatory protein PII
MRKIEAVIPPESLGNVSEALLQAKISAFRANDVTLFDAGNPKGRYRGTEYTVGQELVKLELVLPDQDVESAVEAIRLGIQDAREGAEILVAPVFDSIHLSSRRKPTR